MEGKPIGNIWCNFDKRRQGSEKVPIDGLPHTVTFFKIFQDLFESAQKSQYCATLSQCTKVENDNSNNMRETIT